MPKRKYSKRRPRNWTAGEHDGMVTTARERAYRRTSTIPCQLRAASHIMDRIATYNKSGSATMTTGRGSNGMMTDSAPD